MFSCRPGAGPGWRPDAVLLRPADAAARPSRVLTTGCLRPPNFALSPANVRIKPDSSHAEKSSRWCGLGDVISFPQIFLSPRKTWPFSVGLGPLCSRTLRRTRSVGDARWPVRLPGAAWENPRGRTTAHWQAARAHTGLLGFRLGGSSEWLRPPPPSSPPGSGLRAAGKKPPSQQCRAAPGGADSWGDQGSEGSASDVCLCGSRGHPQSLLGCRPPRGDRSGARSPPLTSCVAFGGYLTFSSLSFPPCNAWVSTWLPASLDPRGGW